MTATTWTLASPSGVLSMVVANDHANGLLTHELWHAGHRVLQTSKLGLDLEDSDFTNGLSVVVASNVDTIEHDYRLVHGKALRSAMHGFGGFTMTLRPEAESP